MSNEITSYIASGSGFIIGVGLVFLLLWFLRRRKPHVFDEAHRRDNAIVYTIVGMVFALTALPFGVSYFLLCLFYGVSAGFLGIAVTTAIRTRKDKNAS